jgi:hypothetical protein
MIKTIKIAAIMLVVLAVAALVLAVMLGIRPDPARAKTLTEPGVVEIFKKSAGTSSNQTRVSPLVTQAQAFTKRINPPPPPKPTDPNNPGGGKSGAAYLPPPPPPAAFEVVATSINPLDASKSFALLSQPGKGFFWVRPKDEVGRAVIKQILPGKIVTADGREYAIAVNLRPSLLKPGSPVPPGYDNRGLPTVAGRPAAQVTNAGAVERPAAANNAAAPQEAVANPEETRATAAWLKKMMENPESAGLTKEEAAQLGNLGEMLKDVNSVEVTPQGTSGDPNG